MRLADAQQSTPWRAYLLRSEARGARKQRHAPPSPSPDLLLFHRGFSSKFDGKKRSWFLCGLWLQGLTPRSQCSASVPPACALVSSAAPISSYRRFIKRNLRQILVIKLKKKTSLMWIFFGTPSWTCLLDLDRELLAEAAAQNGLPNSRRILWSKGPSCCLWQIDTFYTWYIYILNHNSQSFCVFSSKGENTWSTCVKKSNRESREVGLNCHFWHSRHFWSFLFDLKHFLEDSH